MDRSQEKERNRRGRNSDRKFASDYNYNSNQVPSSERSGHRRFAGDNSNDHLDYPSGREYNYNSFGMGDQQGTWNQHKDDSYDFGEHNQKGAHRGKGPKGFKRTDERIHEDINSRLTDDAYVDASDIEVAVSNGEVTLTGTVPDKTSKRRAEDISELVSGVSNVENRLRVK